MFFTYTYIYYQFITDDDLLRVEIYLKITKHLLFLI